MNSVFVDEMESYFKDRLSSLEMRLVSGAYTAVHGSEALVDGLKKYNLSKDITRVKYDSFTGEEIFLRIDSNGLNRQSNDNQNSVYLTDLSSMISHDLYTHGRKGKLLRTIVYSIFDDFGFRENIMPKEVMNMMERLFNVTFKHDNSGRVFINPKTFSSVFYDVKKKVFENNNTCGSDYDSIKNLGTILLRQEGIEDDEKIKIDFSKLERRMFDNMTPSFHELSNDALSCLNPVLKTKRDYSMKNGMSEEFKGLIYPQLFTKIYNRTRSKLYSQTVDNMSDDELRSFCRSNQESLEFDSKERLKDFGGRGILMFLGQNFCQIIGEETNGYNEQVLGGKLIEHLAIASDTYSQLSLKDLRETLNLSDEDKMKYFDLCTQNLFSSK